jgi:hypothetical protein
VASQVVQKVDNYTILQRSGRQSSITCHKRLPRITNFRVADDTFLGSIGLSCQPDLR